MGGLACKGDGSSLTIAFRRLTPEPCGLIDSAFSVKSRFRLTPFCTIIMVIPFAIRVVYPKERSGKSGSLAKCHKQRLVDLPRRCDECSDEEQC